MTEQELRAFQEAYNQVYEVEEGKQTFPAERVAKQMEKARQSSVYGRDGGSNSTPTDSEQRNTTRFSKMFHAFEKAKREKQNADKARRSPTFYKDTHPASAPKMKKANEEVQTDLFDYILEHLVAEGYADTNEAALAIMANMSEEWRQSIVEETKRTEYLQKKFNKENQKKSGSAHTYIPGKQNTGQALYKARESERQMRGER